MKRFISIIFTLCLVVALTLTASAESTNKLTYAVGASAPTVSANTDFTILVEVTENTGICWFKAVVTYDSSVLTYVDFSTDTSVFDTSSLTVNSSEKGNQGKITIVLGSYEVLFQDNPTIHSNVGKLVTLNFKVNPGVAVGTSTVVALNSTQSNVIKRVNGTNQKDFAITNDDVTIKVMSGDHTCTPSAAVKENEIPATCAADGKYDSVVYCSVCKAEISRKTTTVPKGEHTAGAPAQENLVAATCQAAGSYDEVVKCIHCQTEMSRKKVNIPKTDHTPGESKIENLKDSTCTVKGSYDLVTYCSVCNTKLSSVPSVLNLSAHTPGATKRENEVAATCSKPGSYEEVTYCSVCNAEASRVKKETATTKHVNADSVQENKVAATCSKEGSYDEVVYCSVCKSEVARVTVKVAKVDHKPGKAVEENKKAPVNCGADGTYDSVVYCSVCKVELSRDKKSIPAPDHTPGPAATETTPQTCTVCKTVITPAIGHTHKWSTSWTTDAVGHWNTCSSCDNKNNYETHVYTNGCDADCNVCGMSRTVAGHTYDNDCDDTCNKCNEKRTNGGHKYDNNCDGTCNVCGVERPVTHTYDNNCDAICNVCNAPRIAADHVYGSWTTVKEATATTDGQRERACNVCGAKQTEVIPATGSSGSSSTEVTTEGQPVDSSEPVDTDPVDTDSDTTTGTDETPSQTDEETDPPVEGGCGSAISVGIALVAIIGTALIMKKRD